MIDLVCLGNPLLDLQAEVSPEYLKKEGLGENDAILSEPHQMHIFDDVMAMPGLHIVAGGAAQNTARGAAYVLGPGRVAYIGSVGRDKYSDLLLQANKAAGVESMYQFVDDIPTGKCAALVVGPHRSLVTDLSAANHYKLEHLKAPKQWKVVEGAKVFYVGGFHFTVCVDAIKALGQYAAAVDKPFVINLSAPFIPAVFKDQLDSTQELWDYVIGNEEEARSYGESHGLGTTDVREIAKHIAALPKLNERRKRTVIITQGTEPTVAVVGDEVHEINVRPLEESKIHDTNGAGDAFAGGFVAGLVEGRDLATAIDMGQWLAAKSLQLVGPSYPTERVEYSKN